MKFKDKERTRLLEESRKRLDPAIKVIKTAPYLGEAVLFYLDKIRNTAQGKAKIEKAKTLLAGDSEQALEFQKEILVDTINSVLAIPEEKLGMTPDPTIELKSEDPATKYVLENHNDIATLLVLEDTFGKDFDSGILNVFDIPKDVVAVLAHKRAVVDPAKNEAPDVFRDGVKLDSDVVSEKDIDPAEVLGKQEKVIRELLKKARTASDWGLVAKNIAKYMVLAGDGKAAVYSAADETGLDKRAADYLYDHPDISLNVSMHDRDMIAGLFDDPDNFVNKFHFADEKLEKIIDLNDAYARLRNSLQDAIADGAISEEMLPAGKQFGPVSELTIKAMRVKKNQERIDGNYGIFTQVRTSFGVATQREWQRLFQFGLVIPMNPEDVKANYEFAAGFARNEVRYSEKYGKNLSFRAELLLDTVENVKKLDPTELIGISDEKLVENWPDIKQRWNRSFIVLGELLKVCEAEGVELSEEDKADIAYKNVVGTNMYQPLEFRIDALADPYYPLIEGLDENACNDATTYTVPDFSTRLFFTGMQNKSNSALFANNSEVIRRLKENGLLDVLGKPGVTVRTREVGPAPDDPQSAYYALFKSSKDEPFAVTVPGKAEVFYCYNKFSGSFETGASFENAENRVKYSEPVTVKIDKDASYEYKTARSLIKDAVTYVTNKHMTGKDLTVADIARGMAIQMIYSELEDIPSDKYVDRFKELASEEKISAKTAELLSDPRFSEYLKSVGGLGKDGIVPADKAAVFSAEGSFEGYRRFCEIAEENSFDLNPDWTKKLDMQGSLDMMTDVRLDIIASDKRFHNGIKNAAHFKVTEDLFKYGLLKKNADQKLGLSMKEISELAFKYTYDPAYSELKSYVFGTDSLITNAKNLILKPDADYYRWEDRIYKLIDHFNKTKSPEFETPGDYFEKKYTETFGKVDDNDAEKAGAKAEALKEFLSLSKANDAIRFGNPEKAVSYERLWDLQQNASLKNIYDTAVKQKSRLHPDPYLKQEGNSVSKKEYQRILYYNIPEEPGRDDLIKREKATFLLYGNSREALEFQKEYVVEIINKALALPDEKLAMHGSDEASAYYTDHFREITALFEIENFMGGKDLLHGVRDDFDIPEEYIDILRHKKDLAQQNITREVHAIQSRTNKNYKFLELFKGLSVMDLGVMISLDGGPLAVDNDGRTIMVEAIGAANSTEEKISDDNIVKQDAEKYDGRRLDPDTVAIKTPAVENDTLAANIVNKYYGKLSSSTIKKNAKFAEFSEKFKAFRENVKKSGPDKKQGEAAGEFYSDIAKAAKACMDALTSREKGVSELDEDRRQLYSCASEVEEYCRAMTANVRMNQRLEKANLFAAKTDEIDDTFDVSLELKIDYTKKYTKEEYLAILAENRKAVEDAVLKDLGDGKKADRKLLARLLVLDGIRKKIDDPDVEPEMIEDFFSEEYVSESAIDMMTSNRDFAAFIDKNEPVTGSFIAQTDKANLAERFVRYIREVIEAEKTEEEIKTDNKANEKTVFDKLADLKEYRSSQIEDIGVFTNQYKEEKLSERNNNRFGIRADRMSICSLTICKMLQTGKYSLDAILDPAQLKDEKKQFGDLAVAEIKGVNKNEKEQARDLRNDFLAGGRKIAEYLENLLSEMPDLSMKTILDPKYKNLVSASKFLYDAVQELEHNGIKNYGSEKEQQEILDFKSIAQALAGPGGSIAEKAINTLNEQLEGNEPQSDFISKFAINIAPLSAANVLFKQAKAQAGNKRLLTSLVEKNKEKASQPGTVSGTIKETGLSVAITGAAALVGASVLSVAADVNKSLEKNGMETVRKICSDFLEDKINFKVEVNKVKLRTGGEMVAATVTNPKVLLDHLPKPEIKQELSNSI